MESSWRNAKHRQQWVNTLDTYVLPFIGTIPVDEIKTADILNVLEPIWRTVPETASRIRGRIEVILNSAKARGLRGWENPAAWRGHLDNILPPRKRVSRGHHKAMDIDAVPIFVLRLRDMETIAAMALEFTILTAARTSEVINASWNEIDLEKAVWTVPASRMKAGKVHRIPLSSRAIDILQSASRLGGRNVFVSQRHRSLSAGAMSMLLRRSSIDATVHGFRSCFRDWAAERTDYSPEVTEMALAHTIQNKAEAAYRRGDLLEKRRPLMDDWAAFCGGGNRQE
jgi:integrase